MNKLDGEDKQQFKVLYRLLRMIVISEKVIPLDLFQDKDLFQMTEKVIASFLLLFLLVNMIRIMSQTYSQQPQFQQISCTYFSQQIIMAATHQTHSSYYPQFSQTRSDGSQLPSDYSQNTSFIQSEVDTECATVYCFDQLLQSGDDSTSQSHHINIHDNRQGFLSILIPQPQHIHFEQNVVDSFNFFINAPQKQDFSALVLIWSIQLIQKLAFIIDNWKQYSASYKQPLQKFLNMFEKNYNCQLIQTIYPGLDKIICKLQKKIDRQIKNNLMGQTLQSPNNFFFKKYLNELVLRANKEGSLFLINPDQTKKALGQHISENNLFAKNKETWQMIFFIAFCRYRCNKEGTKFDDIKQQIDKIYKFADLILQGNQLTQPCNRICCSRFFYLNFDISPIGIGNILCRKKLGRLKRYLPISKKEKGREYIDNNKKMEINDDEDTQKNELDETMLDICAILNCGGGVVLFNVEREYLQLRPFGQSLIKYEMDAYKSLILQNLKKITPKVEQGHQVNVTYVPLVKHPYQYGYMQQVMTKDDRKANRIYIDGLYVLRIAAIPSRRQNMYCYTTSTGQTQSAVVEGGKRRDVAGEQLVLQMKRKFYFHHIQDADEQLSKILAKDCTYVDYGHKCVQPYLGKLVYRREQPQLQQNPEPKFLFMSLMVVSDPNYNEVVKKILLNKGIQNQIYNGLKKYKLKAAMSSVPIFHNIRFDQLLTQVAYRPEFKFGNRATLVIRVTQFLKFVNRKGQDYLSVNDFNTLQKWLQKEFPAQELQYWTYRDDDNIVQHYLHTGSKLSLVFIYYVMYQFNEKSMFKDPKSSRQLSTEEKNLRMKLIYPTNKPTN